MQNRVNWLPFRTVSDSNGHQGPLASAFFPVPAAKVAPKKPAAPLLGVQIVSNGNEPELRVGGVPFFIHAAQFDYFRIPPDLWFRSLDRYRELGINTIDLRIPWNWHEPRDAEFDFDGHTNPRRNLRGLLQLIAEKRLKLIARPGPLIGDQWRNAGYPAWLLAYSDYKMSAAAIEKGMRRRRRNSLHATAMRPLGAGLRTKPT